jgi:hypothetical protein
MDNLQSKEKEQIAVTQLEHKMALWKRTTTITLDERVTWQSFCLPLEEL